MLQYTTANPNSNGKQKPGSRSKTNNLKTLPCKFDLFCKFLLK